MPLRWKVLLHEYMDVKICCCRCSRLRVEQLRCLHEASVQRVEFREQPPLYAAAALQDETEPAAPPPPTRAPRGGVKFDVSAPVARLGEAELVFERSGRDRGSFRSSLLQHWGPARSSDGGPDAA